VSVEQVESAILQLSSQDRQRLLAWLNENRRDLFMSSTTSDLTEAQQTEILRRRQDYYDRPETFAHINTEAELDSFFEGVRREVEARVSSARRG
jgi:hypothetical protein